MSKIYTSADQLIGKTPLLELSHIEEKLGLKVGIVRPITVWPYPYKAVFDAANQPSVKEVVSIEMSCGQMVDDVKIAVNGVKPVSFYGRTGGVVPTVKDILNYLSGIKEGK